MSPRRGLAIWVLGVSLAAAMPAAAQQAVAPERDPPVAGLGMTAVPGGEHLDTSGMKSDSQIVGRMLESSDPDQRNLAVVMRFVDSEARLHGAVKACSPARASLFRRCAFLILSHWKAVYGSDLPKVQLDDGRRTEQLVLAAWQMASDSAEARSRDNQAACPDTESAVEHSNVWQYCSAPDWSSVTP